MKVQGKVLHSIWGSGGMAPKKLLYFIGSEILGYFTVLLQIKLNNIYSYACTSKRNQL